MQFKIEKISEDSFYVNLLLGLPKLIKRFEKLGMKHYYLKRFPPLGDGVIMEWEQSNGVLLPPDIRQFYMSTNGFLFKWNLHLGCDESDIVGKIEINPLQDLVQLPQTNNIEITKNSISLKPALGMDVKIFELVKFGNKYSVVLVFAKYRFTQNVWVCTGEKKFYYLTHDFTSYFRMCIAHLGIPCWQLIYTNEEQPQWIQNLFLLLMPTIPIMKRGKDDHLAIVRRNNKREKVIHNDKLLSLGDMHSLNTLDVGVFTGNFNVDDKKVIMNRKKANTNCKSVAKLSRIGVRK